MPQESVEVSINGFSGPLDLLCHLVESRQMQASEIKVTQLVRIYGAWLLKTRKAPMDMLSEFFYMVAGLLLQKTLSLLPGAVQDGLPDGLADDENLPVSEEELLEKLARYRPYRTATAWLEERKVRRERRFRRVVPDAGERAGSSEIEPVYDVGDLYFLARLWWGLFERRAQARRKKNGSIVEPVDNEADNGVDHEWDGVPEALPEESQIQSRIAELEAKLSCDSVLSLNALWALSPNIRMLVVTLLAVLEMCRMGKVRIEQETPFADVKICAK
ncbi:MAG: segregation/condensation protein A [Synergistaceae bacterium]|jgi:segregation and condensation protein A|nr:segregation/condensation protein A [Synergistaceae bacterium]